MIQNYRLSFTRNQHPKKGTWQNEMCAKEYRPLTKDELLDLRWRRNVKFIVCDSEDIRTGQLAYEALKADIDASYSSGRYPEGYMRLIRLDGRPVVYSYATGQIGLHRRYLYLVNPLTKAWAEKINLASDVYGIAWSESEDCRNTIEDLLVNMTGKTPNRRTYTPKSPVHHVVERVEQCKRIRQLAELPNASPERLRDLIELIRMSECSQTHVESRR